VLCHDRRKSSEEAPYFRIAVARVLECYNGLLRLGHKYLSRQRWSKGADNGRCTAEGLSSQCTELSKPLVRSFQSNRNERMSAPLDSGHGCIDPEGVRSAARRARSGSPRRDRPPQSFTANHRLRVSTISSMLQCCPIRSLSAIDLRLVIGASMRKAQTGRPDMPWGSTLPPRTTYALKEYARELVTG